MNVSRTQELGATIKSSSMAALANLKATHLRSLLTSIGGKTSGTKPQLLSRLQHEVHTNGKLARATPAHAPQRILSVDMGIKNLAFCVADITAAAQPPPLAMHIAAWQRISLLAAAPGTPPSGSAAGDAPSPFAPPQLSRTAHALVTGALLPWAPAAILLERQRFRSGGGAAVQEWTLRVNALEAMVWAVLRALGAGADLVAVEPARVAAFWLPRRRAVAKADKVGAVRGWVREGGCEGEGLRVTFGERAARARDAFLGGPSVGRRSKVPAVSVDGSEESLDGEVSEGVGKLDDLADCLLQAAAWAKWKSNKDVLNGIWDDEDKIKEFAEKGMEG